MNAAVSALRPAPANAATQPALTDALRAAVGAKSAAALVLLREAVAEFGANATNGKLAFANSFGAEDMVLTDLILSNALPITVFSLDTGRLPAETYSLIGEVERHYGSKLEIYFPDAGAVETFVRSHGINAFYDSVELRKACCGVRKMEPLRRALAGRKAWITGLRAAQSVTRAGLPVRETDTANGLEKLNPLTDWTETEVWAYIRINEVPYNALHDQFYPSIGCAPCTRAIALGEDVRAGRWWWENPETKECGLHVKES
ncbi:phosphoadenosine phosphosulfate reductase [Thauera phenylacetica B4P]|uniref:Adenosine 5'-phosphosulfate reductase n=1 Tax=Thauera phenylacetica B4P TaxID=1234382 RepID=N6ZMI0_9RHOO|nr:phosphoadenylyl-sulfate reductase [Thauera phenylacetica]ENO95747.1 phosphoadenosine phosphosulfate reductase [Thauera phenylacetica B4P]